MGAANGEIAPAGGDSAGASEVPPMKELVGAGGLASFDSVRDRNGTFIYRDPAKGPEQKARARFQIHIERSPAPRRDGSGL